MDHKNCVFQYYIKTFVNTIGRLNIIFFFHLGVSLRVCPTWSSTNMQASLYHNHCTQLPFTALWQRHSMGEQKTQLCFLVVFGISWYCGSKLAVNDLSQYSMQHHISVYSISDQGRIHKPLVFFFLSNIAWQPTQSQDGTIVIARLSSRSWNTLTHQSGADWDSGGKMGMTALLIDEHIGQRNSPAWGL